MSAGNIGLKPSSYTNGYSTSGTDNGPGGPKDPNAVSGVGQQYLGSLNGQSKQLGNSTLFAGNTKQDKTAIEFSGKRGQS